MLNIQNMIDGLVDDALVMSDTFEPKLKFALAKSTYQSSPLIKELDNGILFVGSGNLCQAVYSSVYFESGVHQMCIKFEKFN